MGCPEISRRQLPPCCSRVRDVMSKSESDVRNRGLDISHAVTKALLVCGVVAGPLFTVTWLAEGTARADYDPLTHPISSLSIGHGGWMQVVSFIITGLLVVAFSIGLVVCLVLQAGSGDHCPTAWRWETSRGNMLHPSGRSKRPLLLGAPSRACSK
jgi:Protein of unknown function (DUF998)